MACRRHVAELYLGAAWSATFPEPTTQPADVLCERLWKFAESGQMPESLQADTCPYVLNERAKVFKPQRERIANLLPEVDGEEVGSDAKPRNDYQFFWELIKVDMNYFQLI